jgi:hypothetical protein
VAQYEALLAADASADLSKVNADVRNAITWGAEAWAELGEATFRNCWRKSGLLPSAWNLSAESVEHDRQVANTALQAELNQLDVLIDSMRGELGDDALSAVEFVTALQGEQDIEAHLTDEQLIEVASGRAAVDQVVADEYEEAKDDDQPVRVVQRHDAIQYAAGLLNFTADNSSFFTDVEVNALESIMDKLTKLSLVNVRRMVQPRLDARFGFVRLQPAAGGDSDGRGSPIEDSLNLSSGTVSDGTEPMTL